MTHHAHAQAHVGFAILTVSDTRTPETDASGALIRELLTEAGHEVPRTDLVKDEPDEIVEALHHALADVRVDVVVVTGGTGVAPRDVTPDAVEPLFDRSLPGFGEIFRMLSYEDVGAMTMLSRASAGLVGGKPVFLLPGSRKAVGLAVQKLILPAVGHLVALSGD